MTTAAEQLALPKFKYVDDSHRYTLGGRLAFGISTTAKIVADTYAIETWAKRQVAIGVALDSTIRENIACFIDNNQRVNLLAEEAKKRAGAHRKADRGTQAHRALELTLLGRRDELLTAQQQADAAALQNTLDRYGLTPTPWAERFVVYPERKLCGRFDAILQNRRGELVMSDLKTGLNAVRYPHATCVQLALYRNAPWVAETVQTNGNETTVLEWGRLPELRADVGYVIQLEPDADCGTVYELNIEHGWAGAQLALDVRSWRQQFGGGSDLATLLDPMPANGSTPTWRELIEGTHTLTELRLLYASCRTGGALTPQLRGMFLQRSQQLGSAT